MAARRPLDLPESVHGEAPSTLEPALVAGPGEGLQERVAVSRRAVAEAGALLGAVRSSPPRQLGPCEQQVLVEVLRSRRHHSGSAVAPLQPDLAVARLEAPGRQRGPGRQSVYEDRLAGQDRRRLAPEVLVPLVVHLQERVDVADEPMYGTEEPARLAVQPLRPETVVLATVAQGDITLTPLGETFAEASILARKEIFATRIRRLPMFKWLLAMLRAADKHQLDRDVISTALELDFTPDEAARQVEVAINWGRYAELLAYDDTSEMLSLDTSSAPLPTTC